MALRQLEVHPSFRIDKRGYSRAEKHRVNVQPHETQVLRLRVSPPRQKHWRATCHEEGSATAWMREDLDAVL